MKSISEAEWSIMQVLWDTPGITLKEIAAALDGRGWSYTTIRTMVSRLSEKGAIIADKTIPNNFRYRAALPETECKAQEAKSFLSRVFEGSAYAMFAALAGGSKLTKTEADELRALIDSMDERSKEKNE